MRFIGPDSVLGLIADVAVISMLLFVGSLGIVTFGPALVAAFGCTLAILRDEGGPGFFRRFAAGFWTSALSGLVMIGVVVLAGVDLWVLHDWDSPLALATRAIILGTLALVVIMSAWYFAQLSQTPGQFKKSLKVAVTLFVRWPVRSLAVLPLAVWPAALLVVRLEHWAYVVALLFFFGAGFSVYMLSLLGNKPLEPFRAD